MRKGMGKGTGKGYKNLVGTDKRIHSMSAKGIKQPQRINTVKFINPNILTKLDKEWMDTLDGNEIWTNAFGERFGERVCVGINNRQITHKGQKFTPTKKEFKELKDDYLIQEYGTTNMKEIMRMEGF